MSRILHILSQIPSLTGSGIFLDNMILEADKKGHHQSAVLGLPVSMNEYPFHNNLNIEIHRICFGEGHLDFPIPGMSDVMPYASSQFRNLSDTQLKTYRDAFYQAVREAVLSFSPDVILSNHLWLATSTVVEVLDELYPSEQTVEGKSGRPLLMAICHGTDLRQLQLCPHLASRVIKRCANADLVLGLHHRQLEQLKAIFGFSDAQLLLVGNGFNSNFFNLENRIPFSSNQKIHCVYAGKLSYSKGLIQLLKAMERLSDDFHLTIVGKGSGSEAEAILSEIERLKNKVTYAGYLTQQELAHLYKQAHVFILPSFYEGLPLVVIEALASGLSVVVNDLAGLRDWIGEVVNQSGQIRYVPMPDLEGLDQCKKTAEKSYVEDLSAAIEQSGHRIKLNMDFDYNAYSAIEEMSWEKVFAKIETAIGSWRSKAL